MTIEFDPHKNYLNIQRHGIPFSDVIPFLYDSKPDIDYDEKHSSAEEVRFRGTFRNNDRYLFIVYTMHNETIRLISARPAVKAEINHYWDRNTA